MYYLTITSIPRMPDMNADQARVAEAIRYIRQNLAEQPGLDEIAALTRRAEHLLQAGCYPFPLEDRRGVHGNNERVSVENLEKGTRLMIDLIEQRFQMEGAESLELLTRAMSEMAENPELGQALIELAPTLSDQDKEDIALMALKVIAADGRRNVSEMEKFNEAVEAMVAAFRRQTRRLALRRPRYWPGTWTPTRPR